MPPMIRKSTRWRASTRQIAMTWSSARSAAIARQAVAAGAQSGAFGRGQGAFPLGEDLVVVVAFGELHPQLQSGALEEPQQGRHGWLPSARLVRGKGRLCDAEEIGEGGLGQPSLRAGRSQQGTAETFFYGHHAHSVSSMTSPR